MHETHISGLLRNAMKPTTHETQNHVCKRSRGQSSALKLACAVAGAILAVALVHSSEVDDVVGAAVCGGEGGLEYSIGGV